MTFFDKLGAKITNTSKDVAKKTKDLAEITKINIQISSEEDKIKNKYQEIGKLYYELYHGKWDQSFEVLCDEIAASSNAIESAKRQIQHIKGVKTCTNCGGEIPLTTSFCGSCGTKVEEEPILIDLVEADYEIVEQHCVQCDSVLSADAVFCTSCGEKVENS